MIQYKTLSLIYVDIYIRNVVLCKACYVYNYFYNIIYNFFKSSHMCVLAALGSEAAEAPDVEGQERKVLEERVGRRLAETQVLLTKEVVLWNHGYLAMPQVSTSLSSNSCM